MENESFERALDPQLGKRKRSSILKPPEKRVSRDSRTVSFNDRCVYKELHMDGTCDITNLFLREDMDLTMMDLVGPEIDIHNQTINSSMDMSTDQNSIINTDNITLVENNNCSLAEDKMIEEKEHYQPTYSPPRPMDLTLIGQFMSNNNDLGSITYDASTIYDTKKMSIGSDMSAISSLDPSLIESPDMTLTEAGDHDKTLVPEQQPSRTEQLSRLLNEEQHHASTTTNCSIARISDISSLNESLQNLPNQSMNDTFFGAFHDSNLSLQSTRTSGDTMLHNIDALNNCIQKVDQEIEDRRHKLDAEIQLLFEWYQHIVNKDNKYEFAISIIGLRLNLWLIIKVNPDTYPNEKLNLRFAVNKKDRHLYPFPEFALAVRKCTQEGRPGYLTKFIINSQRFRRFLRTISYRKKTNK